MRCRVSDEPLTCPSGLFPVKIMELQLTQHAEQTPFFVSQGNYTEFFCEKDKTVEETLNDILNGTTTPTPTVKAEDTDSPLLRAIIKDEGNYRGVEDVATIIKGFKATIDQTIIESDIKGIFDVSYEFEEDLKSFNQKSEVGEWLKANKNRYKARYETSKMLGSDTLSSFGLSLPENDPLKELSFLKSMPHTYVSGFEVEVKLPYQVIIAKFKSKHKNVDDYVGIITFLYSNISLRYFYYLGVCTCNKYRPVESVTNLATIDCKYAEENSVEQGLFIILNQLQQELISILTKKFVDSSSGVK